MHTFFLGQILKVLMPGKIKREKEARAGSSRTAPQAISLWQNTKKLSQAKFNKKSMALQLLYVGDEEKEDQLLAFSGNTMHYYNLRVVSPIS
jgi:hypothetical protein